VKEDISSAKEDILSAKEDILSAKEDILPLIHAGQAAGSRFHFHSAFMEGGSGILPLFAIQPEPRRLCRLSARGQRGARTMRNPTKWMLLDGAIMKRLEAPP